MAVLCFIIETHVRVDILINMNAIEHHIYANV